MIIRELWGQEFYDSCANECQVQFGEVTFEAMLVTAVAKLVQSKNDCPHPGCCCVCGHTGKCPEDGPSIVEGVDS